MKLYETVGRVLGVDPASLSPESNAQNTPNWNSLRHIELIMAVESSFGVRFAFAEISSLRNLGDMQHLLETKGAQFDDGAAANVA